MIHLKNAIIPLVNLEHWFKLDKSSLSTDVYLISNNALLPLSLCALYGYFNYLEALFMNHKPIVSNLTSIQLIDKHVC